MRLDDSNLADYLRRVGLLQHTERARVEPAGDGNINFVRRVRGAEGRSWVVKQARPQLERFPEYRVSTERIVFEHRYGEVVAELAPDAAGLLPRTLHFDAEARILVMEDLGDAPCLGDELLAGRVEPAVLQQLGRFLGRVHGVTAPHAGALAPRFANDEMRQLHGEHIFSLPFAPNNFPIPQELRALGRKLLEESGGLERIHALRERYYQTAEALVHADVQGSNLLIDGNLPRLVDAEIAHVGDPAFDLGTALAHIHFHIAREPDQPAYRQAREALLRGYEEGGGEGDCQYRAAGYAGVEMLRRTLGAARLPFLEQPAAAVATLQHATRLLQS